MRRFKVLGPIVCFLFAGCTVGWYDLREPATREAGRNAGFTCPKTVEIVFSSHLSMDPMPPRPATAEYLRLARAAFRVATDQVLANLGCALDRVGPVDSGPPLRIEIIEEQKLRPLPQEIVTGLTFGLIPSWSTRSEELRFTFSSNGVQTSYAVDEKRINHILLLPVSWLSLVLTNAERTYEDALEEFLSRR